MKKKDKVILKFDGKADRQKKALIYAGYRINFGKRGESYVMDINEKSRFHAYVLDFGLEIHLDRTNAQGWHYVAGRSDKRMLANEGRRVMSKYRELRKDYFAERARLGIRDEWLDTKTISELIKKMKEDNK